MFVGDDAAAGSDEEEAVLGSSSGNGSASSKASHVVDVVDSPGHTLQETTLAISAVKGGETKEVPRPKAQEFREAQAFGWSVGPPLSK
jgi:hypothetical protein